jgi:hypothetical protein
MELDGDAILLLLALGPASAVGLYWAIHRHYRNTHQSHAYERETAVAVLALGGSEADHKIDEVRGTRASRIQGDNAGQHRQRVQPM